MTIDLCPIRLAAVLLAAATVACPARRQGPELPDLDQPVDRVSRRLERTRKIRQVMDRDIERVQSLSEQLSSLPTDLFGDGFPLALFKHVAVHCLNTSAVDTVPDAPPETSDTTTPDSSQKHPLRCRPTFYGRLEQRLADLPDQRRQRALTLLQKIDEFHTLRVRLWRRIRKTDDILEDNRNFIASRRADLRKRRRRWKRRRQELSEQRWDQLTRRFARYAAEIDRLAEASRTVAEARSSWPETLDRANREMYLAITSHWKRPN